MSTEQLQFIFSLFSFVGVVGILFYLILQKAKQDEKREKLENLERELSSLTSYFYDFEAKVAEEKCPNNESSKEKIIELYDEGKDLIVIAQALDVPIATVEMVIKFHKLKKSDNWRDSAENRS
jgi:hypothetical protein